MPYQPIENYGLIGNMRTAALVGVDGSIDWLCYPDFDSPSVFAALLDDAKGGRFRISPSDPQHVTYKQLYWPDSNVLITRFLTPDGVGEVVDFMPLAPAVRGHLIRRVRVVHGTLRFRLVCEPAFNYARDEHELRLVENGAIFHAPSLSLALTASVPLEQSGRGVTAEFTLHDEEEVVFVLSAVDAGITSLPALLPAEAEAWFEATVDYWHDWLTHCTYTGRWRETIYRSALLLKLLTYEPSGAIVAAPTTSLPEFVGGTRNWDYRYTWLRDAAFTLYALMRIGFMEEAASFMDWLNARCHEQDPGAPLQPLYGIRGEHELPEFELAHLEGYRKSRPVRIGNAAYQQFQIDIYGEVMDSVYLYNKYGTFIDYDLWHELRRLTNWVADNWHLKDVGVWEVRSEPQHFVFSKVMCWVALDRALRMADKRGFPAEHQHWRQARNALYEDIMQHGWNEQRQAFTRSYGGDDLDAANLIMPLVFFVGSEDPMMLSTIDAVRRPIHAGGLSAGGQVYRYNTDLADDGLDHQPEGTFNMCTFWLVEGLTRAGRLGEARLMFERMLGFANHLGLYAEQTGPQGEALGNFPQGFTHLGLISAAFNLDRALRGRDHIAAVPR